MITTVKQLAKSINGIAADYLPDTSLLIEGLAATEDDDKVHDLDQTFLPSYKRYTLDEEVKDYLVNVQENAINNLARTAVITADRLVSSLSHKQLSEHLEEQTLGNLLEKQLNNNTDLTDKIKECLAAFEQNPNADSDRNNQQTIAALKLAETETGVSSVKVLQGPAGCGKTKIALEWAANTQAKQIIWICPRVQVCQGLIKDLTAANYLPDTKIEINTGEFKYLYQFGNEPEDTPEGQEFSGDIVITTIDQITNAIITHRNITSLVDYMNAHVVFDEYHEYINMPAFNLLFAELVQCKAMQKEQAKALLVSATPNYYFVNQFLGIDKQEIVGISSFNKSQYKIIFNNFNEKKQDDSNPLYQSQPEQTFVISNTAITAQKSFIDHQGTENAILLHSKFKKSDKEDLFQKTFSSFKQHGTKDYALLRSGPIIQASLNISCLRMVTEFTHAENWLQRLGRLDRFGENSETNLYITAVPDTLADAKQNGACARFLNALNSLQNAKAWYAFLQDRLPEKPITITEIYELYQAFYNDKTCLNAIEEDFIKALKKSVEVIQNKLIDPVTLPRKQALDASTVKIKKHSLRGDNRFVQMAICTITETEEIEFPNQYAYAETANEAELTASVEEICGYGNSEQNLLAFMVKKHHNIKEVNKAYKDSVLLNEARIPDTPIYLSYVPDDLKKVEAQPHPYAIYYVHGNNQPIGAMSITNLTEQGK